VLADAAALTVFTYACYSQELADAAASTFYTLAPHPLALTDATALTVFTRAFLHRLRRRWCSHRLGALQGFLAAPGSKTYIQLWTNNFGPL